MANIIITNQCNARCDFCFAQDYLQKSSKHLSLQNLEERIQWAKTSGLTQFRLMGGEPTQHPQFEQIVEKIIDARFTLILFSNGYINDHCLSALSNIPDNQCALLVNINAVSRSSHQESQRIKVLNTLKQKITLGYTILNPVFNLEPILGMIQDYNLQPKLRLGLAMPIYNGSNNYLAQKHYPLAAKSILKNAKIAAKSNIRFEFDCGFVRCMFTDEEWQKLKLLNTSTNLHCGPNLDIDIEGTIFHCFSLQNLTCNLDSNVSIPEIYSQLMSLRKTYQNVGIFPECSTCKELSTGHCSGGCLSLTMKRLHFCPESEY